MIFYFFIIMEGLGIILVVAVNDKQKEPRRTKTKRSSKEEVVGKLQRRPEHGMSSFSVSAQPDAKT
jgi:hypothetical protein